MVIARRLGQEHIQVGPLPKERVKRGYDAVPSVQEGRRQASAPWPRGRHRADVYRSIADQLAKWQPSTSVFGLADDDFNARSCLGQSREYVAVIGPTRFDRAKEPNLQSTIRSINSCKDRFCDAPKRTLGFGAQIHMCPRTI